MEKNVEEEGRRELTYEVRAGSKTDPDGVKSADQATDAPTTNRYTITSLLRCPTRCG